MFLSFISDEQISIIKQEIISAELKIYLTRLLHHITENMEDESGKIALIKK